MPVREYGSVEPFPKGRKITFFRPLPMDRDGEVLTDNGLVEPTEWLHPFPS
jgi:hypothetical protein